MMWRPPVAPPDVETNARDQSADESKINPDGTRLAAPAADLTTPNTNQSSLAIGANKRKEPRTVDGNDDDSDTPVEKRIKVTKTDKPDSPLKRKKLATERLSRAKKPKEMPRRPLSAYNIFFKTSREQMMASLKAQQGDGADSSGGKIGFATLAKTIGKKWKELGAEELEIYKAKAQEDTHRYKRQMEDYHQSIARKRKIILPPAPAFAWDYQGDAEASDEELPMPLTDVPRQAENPVSMQRIRDSRHLVDDLISLQHVRDSVAGDCLENRAMNYGGNTFAAGLDQLNQSRQMDSEQLRQQYAHLKRQGVALREATFAAGLDHANQSRQMDSEQLRQQYAYLTRQELSFREVAPFTEARASMVQEQSTSMYDWLLSEERLRSQHHMLIGGDGPRYQRQHQQQFSPSYTQSFNQSLFELQQQHQQQLATQQLAAQQLAAQQLAAQQLAAQQRTSLLLEQLLQQQHEQHQITDSLIMPSRPDLTSRHPHFSLQFPTSLSNQLTTRGREENVQEHNSSDESL